jgi:CheY-like chemotaxis protein
MRDERERLLQCGFDGYVSQPIDLKMLNSEIKRLVAGA